ncbi:hypothetical protein D3C72_1420440 [compost metagenome]
MRQRRGDLRGRHREGRVPRRDEAHHADRLARHVDLHAGAHRGHVLATAAAQGLAREELEDLARARHLGHGLGQCLADLSRQQQAQLVLAGQQLGADAVEHVGAPLRRAVAPVHEGLAGRADRQVRTRPPLRWCPMD